ncbi:4-substituted benzoates-glutamate ligase GH3.12 [Cardamine amara subsp. amara]|uniref:4-substituted benzoates-glutamate ligase GH3.12 n=1 Tax=Cardamine amara subsp. amara TaxID=228776 RepID=A0ABD1BRM5_CARAN
MTYEDVKPYLDRLANGEPSDILSALPISGFLQSSGTSGGKQKILPLNDKYLENMRFIYDLRSLIISKHFVGVEQGKGMMFLFTRQESTTSSCLPSATVTTSFFKSKYFRDRPSYWYNSYTSPDEVIWCPDRKQSLYCHLLCGLVQRDHDVS